MNKKLRATLQWLTEQIAKYKYCGYDDYNTQEDLNELLGWRCYLLYGADDDNTKLKKFKDSGAEFRFMFLKIVDLLA